MRTHLLLRGGPTHDFAATSSQLAEVFADVGLGTVVVDEPADAVDALRAGTTDAPEVAALTVNALRWSMAEPRYAGLRDRFAVDASDVDLAAVDAFVRAGGGMLALHTAVICFDGDPVWRELCGAAWVWGRSSHPAAGQVAVRVTEAGRVHPVTAGLDDFVVDDELYGDLDVADDVEPLLVGTSDDGTHPVLWARELGAGRVVTDLLGHGPASIDHPAHRRTLAGAASWITGEAP